MQSALCICCFDSMDSPVMVLHEFLEENPRVSGLFLLKLKLFKGQLQFLAPDDVCLWSRRFSYESWVIKKAKSQRIDAFKLWCQRRLLRMPWAAKRSNQQMLKEINPEYSLEGLMLKLKLQHSGYLMKTAYSLEKTLMLGKVEGRRSGRQRMRWMNGITDSMDMSLSKL